MTSTRRVCMAVVVLFAFSLLFWAGCGSRDEDLKIIIEDTTGGTEPTFPAPDATGPSPAPEPGTTSGPETGIATGPGDTVSPVSPPTGEAREMNMGILEVVSLVTASPEFEEDEILAALPKMMVGNRPQNALWGVRMMIRDTLVAEYVVDDNTREIIISETYFDRIRDVLEGHEATELKKHMENFGAPSLGYDDALKIAMMSPEFPVLATSQEFWVSIVYIRFEKQPVWSVAAGYRDSADGVNILMNDSGVIIKTDIIETDNLR